MDFKQKQKGFTLIELVMVIILLGVLSAFAMSRFSSGQSYSSVIVKNQLLAVLRLSQQTALSRSSSGANVILTLTSSAGNWSFVTSGGGGNSFASSIEIEAETIRFGTNLVAACSTLSALPLTISFDGDGNRIPQSNLRICIDSDTVYELCISPSGYAYEGACL
jgi:MSHA pilin protein MshC